MITDPDVNNDGVVDILDVSLVSSCLDEDPAVNAQCAETDINIDGRIDLTDLDLVIAALGETGFPVADTTPPVLTIDGPSNLAFLNAVDVGVTGTSDDLTATVSVNGIPAPLQGQSFSATVSLHEGTNLITATATDPAGNVGSASISVVVDTRAPRVVIDSPTDGAVTTLAQIDVAGMINDIVVGTVNDGEASVTVNGTPAAVANRRFLATQVSLVPGPNPIEVIAVDRAGNQASATVTVVREDVTDVAQIRPTSGLSQTAAVGSLAPLPLEVELVDADGVPVVGEVVVFRVIENDGAVSAGGAPARGVAVPTDGTGRATVAWTLGQRAGAGSNRVRATAVGFQGMAEFVATGTPGDAAQIVADGGGMQTGVIGHALPLPLDAVVLDAEGNRLPDVPVTFRVTAGGGTLDTGTEQTLITNADGRVSATFVLGPAEGNANHVVLADFLGNAGASAAFAASARVTGNPAETRLTGVVLDNTDAPVPGVTLSIEGTALSAQTNDEGWFELLSVPVGAIHLLADGGTTTRDGSWPSLAYDLVTIAGRENGVGMPIYMLPLDTENQLCVDEQTGGTLTLEAVPGFALEVSAGSATFPDGSRTGCIGVTPVHADRVPMPPNLGGQPRLVVTIQPAGARFDPPAPLTVPNSDGLPPGAITDLYSFDHDLGQFVSIGTGTVTPDGQQIRSDPGVGVLKAGWHGNWLTRQAARIARCPEAACRDVFFSFSPGNWGCQQGAPLPNGTFCVPPPPTFDVSIGGAQIIGADGSREEIFQVGNRPGEENLPDTIAAGDPSCTGPAAQILEYSIHESCRATCMEGACQDTFQYQEIRSAMCTAFDAVFGTECIGEPLRARMRSNLVTHGWRVRCETGGLCDVAGGYVDQPGANEMKLCSGGVPHINEVVLHEMVHGAGVEEHGENVQDLNTCESDLCFLVDAAHGCSKSCLPEADLIALTLEKGNEFACQ